MPSSSAAMRWSTILGVTVLIALLDWFFVAYITSYGLETKVQEVALGGQRISIQLQWLPLWGIVLLSFVAWYETYYRVFPRRGIFEIDPLARLRLVRAIVLSLALFICVMYIPYLIGSNWFWARISETGKSIIQVRDFGLFLLSSVESMMRLNQLWQYSLSQILAPALMILGAWAFGRSARRQKKPR
jgi:hypothetical protein